MSTVAFLQQQLHGCHLKFQMKSNTATIKANETDRSWRAKTSHDQGSSQFVLLTPVKFCCDTLLNFIFSHWIYEVNFSVNPITFRN